MGVTEGAWRLKAILFIVVTMTLLYSTQALFLDINIEGEGLSEYNEYDLSDVNISESDVQDLTQENSGDILSMLGFIWGFLTFSLNDLGLPLWAVFVLNFYVISMVITLAYISYTFVYEFIKGLPFT